MNRHQSNISLLLFFILFITGLIAFAPKKTAEQFVTYIADPKKDNIGLYWKNDNGEFMHSLSSLKNYAESKGQTLIFAMNAGMYMKNHAPQGLFIDQQKIITALDTASGNGNFYLKPNGVFYITTDKTAKICKTEDFSYISNIKYATQSGPMLVIDGEIHNAFRQGSANMNIRNGVGILPDNRIVFAMSKDKINFYDFAYYFKSLGCKNALYLDGFVSRTYLPAQHWTQTDGNFGVIIGVTAEK